METRFTRQADMGRRKIPAKARQALERRIAEFAADPEADHAFAMKLTGRPETRIRQGDYRALVTVEEGWVTVWDMRHRKDVYRQRT